MNVVGLICISIACVSSKGKRKCKKHLDKLSVLCLKEPDEHRKSLRGCGRGYCLHRI